MLVSQIAATAGSIATRLTIAYTCRPHQGRSQVHSDRLSVFPLPDGRPSAEVEGGDPDEQPEDEEARVIEQMDESVRDGPAMDRRCDPDVGRSRPEDEAADGRQGEPSETRASPAPAAQRLVSAPAEKPDRGGQADQEERCGEIAEDHVLRDVGGEGSLLARAVQRRDDRRHREQPAEDERGRPPPRPARRAPTTVQDHGDQYRERPAEYE